MFTFLAQNEDFIEGEKTILSAQAQSGQKIIEVLSGNDFSDVDHIRLGRKGDYTAELCHIDTISGNTITLKTNLLYEHSKNSEVVELFYDQRRLYKEQTAGLGDYAIVGTAKDIQFDNPNGTPFNDASGISGIHYKCTYYNSETDTETSLENAVAATGNDVSYASIFDIRKAAGFTDNAAISDLDILQSLQDSTDEINGKLSPIYLLPLSTVPNIIRDIAQMLSVGRLFQSEYPGIDPQYANVGESRTKEARSLLDKIVNREILLTDANSLELPRVSTKKPSGWPDNTTEAMASEDNGGGNMFRIGMQF